MQTDVQQLTTTRGSYVHKHTQIYYKHMVKFSGASRKCVFRFWLLQISQNIDGFRQHNSQGFLEFLKLY